MDLAYPFLLLDKVGCMWSMLGCNLNPVHAIFLTESALLRNADVGFSLSDMKKTLT